MFYSLLFSFSHLCSFSCIPVKWGALILPCICVSGISTIQMELVHHHIKARRKQVAFCSNFTTRKLIYGFMKMEELCNYLFCFWQSLFILSQLPHSWVFRDTSGLLFTFSMFQTYYIGICSTSSGF